jgi:hypothetical protein
VIALALALAATAAVADAPVKAAESHPDKSVVSHPESAPDSHPENFVFFEPLGNGLLYSLNYERLFPAYNLGVRVGASFLTYRASSAGGSGNIVLASWPIVASYYIGTPRHKLELGLGATILYFASASDSAGVKFEGPAAGLGVAATAVIGYRYIPPRLGPTFGVGFTPLLREDKGFLAWGGASAGVAF